MAVQSVQLSTTGLVPNTSGLGKALAQQLPTPIYIETNDTLAGVLHQTNSIPDYLNKSRSDFQFPYTSQQMALVYTTDNGGQTQWLAVVVTGTGASASYGLAAPAVADVVATPTVANQITYSTNTGGALASSGLATALFNAGNISAGISGTAGILESYPSAATSGKLVLAAVANSGNYTTTISNALAGQATIMSFADVGAATGQFLVKTAALVSGNFPKNSGTAGLVVDSGLAVANVMALNAVNTMAAASQIILDKGTGTESANTVTINKMSGVITTTSLTTAGGATETITLTNSEVAASSVVLASIGNGLNSATNAYSLSVTVTLHTVVFVITNLTAATALNGTLVINFAVF